jgi:hypothetical protein
MLNDSFKLYSINFNILYFDIWANREQESYEKKVKRRCEVQTDKVGVYIPYIALNLNIS